MPLRYPTRGLGLLALLSVPLLALGCNRDHGGKRIYPVRGQVLYNGSPVKDCRVILYRQDDSSDLERPEGYTDESGMFEVTARPDEMGAAAGVYKVVLVWRERIPELGPEGSFTGPNKMPDHLGSPTTTDLQVEVKPGNNKLAPFDIRR
jgi:hypothetical protein